MINFLQTVPIEPQPGFMQQYSFIIMIGLMVLVLWLFMWRPEKEIKETTLLIEVDGNVTLRIDKNMVVADNSDLQRQ